MTYFAPLIRDAIGGIIIEVPFNRRWLTAIRSVVPFKQKRKDGDEWWIGQHYQQVAIEITKHFFPQTIVRAQVAEAEQFGFDKWVQFQQGDVFVPRKDIQTARSVLFVTEDAPMEVVHAAYRALTKLYHPDVGGDEERFKEIQRAWEETRDSN